MRIDPIGLSLGPFGPGPQARPKALMMALCDMQDFLHVSLYTTNQLLNYNTITQQFLDATSQTLETKFDRCIILDNQDNHISVRFSSFLVFRHKDAFESAYPTQKLYLA